MRRVVISGLGIISSLGCTIQDVTQALRTGRSGLKHCPELKQSGLAGSLYAPVVGFDDQSLEPRIRRTMSTAAAYATVAAEAALLDAQLPASDVACERTAIILGGELGGINDLVTMRKYLHSGRKSRSGATGVTKVMDSGASGNAAAVIGARGRAYGVSSGWGSGLTAIRHGVQLIQQGLADRAVCGAAEEDSWRFLAPALHQAGEWPIGYDDRPEKACRPFDVNRCGTVLSAGAGVVVLESWESAVQRSIRPYAEVVGWGSASDGLHAPRANGTGLQKALQLALQVADKNGVTRVDYVHSGAAGLREGDTTEATAIRAVVGGDIPVSSTTGITGLAVGAAGAIQVALTLLMLRGGFLVPTANLEQVDPQCDGLRHVQHLQEQPLKTALCASSSFGCFNECLILHRVDGPRADRPESPTE